MMILDDCPDVRIAYDASFDAISACTKLLNDAWAVRQAIRDGLQLQQNAFDATRELVNVQTDRVADCFGKLCDELIQFSRDMLMLSLDSVDGNEPNE
jgi:hypothetical protein